MLNAVFIVETTRAIESVIPGIAEEKQEHSDAPQDETDAGNTFHGERAGSGRPGQRCPIANQEAIPALPAAGWLGDGLLDIQSQLGS